jgi:indole-3-glycerol phosphate synthase
MAAVVDQGTILDDIISFKKGEVAECEELYPAKLLEKSIYFESDTVSFKSYICRKDLSGVIAEFKRKSPSNGNINEHAKVEPISIGYMQAGAAALSVLTDEHFFGGYAADLTEARKFNYCPILRKDFIIDEYQVIESKSIGADAILLIAAVLVPNQVKSLASLATSLGMEVLLEVRSKQELDICLTDNIDVVGVNNRDLTSFTVDTDVSLALLNDIPADMVKISESGISDPKIAHGLQEAGYDGLLMGERFMKSSRPHIACAEFIKELKELR